MGVSKNRDGPPQIILPSKIAKKKETPRRIYSSDVAIHYVRQQPSEADEVLFNAMFLGRLILANFGMVNQMVVIAEGHPLKIPEQFL